MAHKPARVLRGDPVPARWDPLREMEDVRRRMERLFGDVAGSPMTEDGGPWLPAVDIEETDDGWLVEAELPGVKKDDVTVELRDNELAIHGEVKERERTGVVRRRTRRTGEFDYRVTLPGEVKSGDDIDAELKGGLLTVLVPKAERSSPRRIEVKSE